MKKAIFISYCWKEPSQSIVRNWLCKSLRRRNYEPIIDVDRCGYRDNIDEFEKKIGRGEAVIVVINRSYLESKECMYELSLLYQNERFKERIFPLNIDNKNFGEHSFYIKVCNYWDNQISVIEEELSRVEEPSDTFLNDDLTKFKTIKKNLPNFFRYFYRYNLKDFDYLSKDNFQNLIDEIDGKHHALELLYNSDKLINEDTFI